MIWERKCEVCGRPYVTNKANAKYCGQKCSKEGIRRVNAENRKIQSENKKAEKKKKKDNQKAIVNIAVEAKKAGMSYGQYVAKMGL